MEKTDLLNLISKDREQISFYLEDVPVDRFIQDVKDLVSKCSDKGVIQEAIKKLQELT